MPIEAPSESSYPDGGDDWGQGNEMHVAVQSKEHRPIWSLATSRLAVSAAPPQPSGSSSHSTSSVFHSVLNELVFVPFTPRLDLPVSFQVALVSWLPETRPENELGLPSSMAFLSPPEFS